MIRKAILICLLAASSNVSILHSQEVLDKIVAIVDDNIILRSELQQFSYSLAIQSGVDPLKEQDKFNEILKKTLEDLIVQKVLLVKAKEDSVTVTERQVDAVLDEQIQQMILQAGSEKQVEEYFGAPLRQVRREFREEVEERLLVQKLREAKSFEIQISRREVERFYSAFKDSLPELKKAVKIRHILTSVEASDAAISSARKRAEEILTRLRRGEDFEALAKEFSEDPGSASRGGNLGMMQRGDLVREFEQVAFGLEVGQISEITQTQFGLHIIQLLEKAGEKINTRHILFRVDTSDDDELETQKRLITLKDRILAGELTFIEAAKQYSKDEQTASKGGDLGWFETDEFQVEAFQKAVQDLEVGEISPPIKTRFGYHLILVEERRDERKLDITRDWEQLEKWALELKRRQEFEKYVADVREDVYIEIKSL